MTQQATSDSIHNVWEYPLFEALYGRRARRFGLGFEIMEGPFKYKSKRSPVPLSELEEALLVGAGVGVTGTPLWDTGRPRALGENVPVADGRTFGSTLGGRRTALFFTNDDGVYVMDLKGVSATKVREIETKEEREKIVAFYRNHRKKLRDGRLAIPRSLPPLMGHNMWNSNMPGSTLFMPVCDVSASLIALTVQLVDGEGGRFAGKLGGGMYVVDDRHEFRPAGTEKWVKSGFLDREKMLPLSVLEREACYFIFNEPAVICQNIFLTTEALGVGGWMYCGFLSLKVLEELGFRTIAPAQAPSLPNPVGLDGVFEGYCPPYFSDMDSAVDVVVSGIRPVPALHQEISTAHSMSNAEYHANLLQLSDEGIACTKAICNYIYDTYGKFPGTVDTMHFPWFMQAHHLDLEFYEKFFKAGVFGKTHAAHFRAWHPNEI